MKFNPFDIVTLTIAFLTFVFSPSFKKFKKYLKKNSEQIEKTLNWLIILSSNLYYGVLIFCGFLCSLYALVTGKPLYLVFIIFIGFWAGAEYIRVLPRLIKIK